jgi:hypothetical protein
MLRKTAIVGGDLTGMVNRLDQGGGGLIQGAGARFTIPRLFDDADELAPDLRQCGVSAQAWRR